MTTTAIGLWTVSLAFGIVALTVSPDAINAAIGIGIVTLIVTVLALTDSKGE